MSESLPLGWAECVMGDIAEVIGGGTPDTSDTENFSVLAGVPWLTPADLSEHDEIYISRGRRFLTAKGFRNSSARLLPKGTVLFSSRAPIGYVAIAANDLSTNQGFKSFVCEKGIDSVYLFFYLKFAKPLAEELASGTTFAEISGRNAKQIPVRLAPINEQRRIGAKLEQLLDKVDACQKRLAKIPILLERFRQAVLDAACSGFLTADWREYNETDGEPNNIGEAPEEFPLLPQTWRWRPLQSVCDHVVDCPHSTPKWTASGRICVRTTNFRPGHLDLSEIRYVSEQTFKERIERLLPKPGDILYSREGGILGIACVIPQGVDMCLGQRMMLFRVKGDFRNELLMHWLNSSPILRRVRELTGGSASPHLNVRDIKTFPTPIPPVPEQELIVRRVHDLFSLADQVESHYLTAKTYIDSLKQSILAKAFRGELVPQDPNDEPATVLLERIRQARARQQSGPSVKRTKRSLSPRAKEADAGLG